MISFVLFPQALQPSMNYNILELIFKVLRKTTFTLSWLNILSILNWKNKDGHTWLRFGKFNTLDLLFFVACHMSR